MRGVRGWIRSTIGGLPAAFWYLWTGTLINRLGSFVIIFLAIYLTSVRGFSAAFAGLVLGIYSAGSAGGVLLGGVLADRWGRRPTLLTAHLTAASMMLALGLVRNKYPLLGVALLLGLVTDMARPAFSAMIVDIVPDRDRLRAFTLNYWAVNLGFAGAAMLAGFAAAANYLLLFVVDASTTLITACIVLTKVRETRPRTRTGETARPADGSRPGGAAGSNAPAPGLRTVFADRVFLTFCGLSLLLSVVYMQHLSTLPITMEQDGLPPATYGSVIAVNGVLIVVGSLFVPRLVGSRNRSRVMALAAAITGLGFGLTATAHHALLYAFSVLVWTVGEMLNSPSSATLIAELSPAEMRGRYQGVFSLAWSVAGFAAPVAGGFVQQHAGRTVLWLSCAALGLLVAAGHLSAGPARERRAKQFRTAGAGIGLGGSTSSGPALEDEPAAATT